MVTATVRFLQLNDEFEQVEVARVVLDGGGVTTGGVEVLSNRLLDDVDRADRDAVLEVMRLAPERFDGSYLRAVYEEGVMSNKEAGLDEGGPGSGHHRHRGRPNVHGGSLPGAAGPATAFSTSAIKNRIASSSKLGGGACDSKIIQYKDDGSAVWKETLPSVYTGWPGHDGNSEVAAYRINQLLGGDQVPQTVYARDEQGQKGTSQLFVDGARTGADMGDDHYREISKRDVDMVAALDIITDNCDRHNGNFLYKDGRVIAIDHGHASWDEWQGGLSDSMRSNSFVRKWTDLNKPEGCVYGFWGDENSTYTFDTDLVNQWGKITREQFDRALGNVREEKTVNLDNAWKNLQYIVQHGRVDW